MNYDNIDGVIQTDDGNLILIVSRWDDPTKTIREHPRREFLGIETTLDELHQMFGKDVSMKYPVMGIVDRFERGEIRVCSLEGV
jgi:hypothetical protein